MNERFCYLSPAKLHLLRRSVEPIDEAFDAVGTVLVGSVLTRSSYRDVDVRLILSDNDFQRLFGAELDQYHGLATALWTSLAVTYSHYLSSVTGLDVDFQIQAMSVANDGSERHTGIRDALIVPPPLDPVAPPHADEPRS